MSFFESLLYIGVNPNSLVIIISLDRFSKNHYTSWMGVYPKIDPYIVKLAMVPLPRVRKIFFEKINKRAEFRPILETE